MVVPQLRFKEFDGDWKEDTLKNCITSIDSGWSPQCESYPANSSEWGVLKTTSVDWSGFNSSFNKKLPLELTPRKEIEVKPLDILVTRAGPTERVGVISVVPHSVRSKLMISDKLIRLKANEQNNPLFLGISLSSVKCQNQLQSKTSGLAKSQTNISQKILGEVLLKLPSKKEQTKIASFLSAVDEKIIQLSQKHELLSQYKQGMMQKLFSQQLRFKADDGSEFGEWEEIALGKIKGVSIASGKSSHEKLELAKYYYYGSTGVIGYSNEYDYQGTRILIARVGHNAGYIYMVSGQYNVSDNTLILELPSNLDYIFIRALLEKFQLNKLVFGTGQPLITGGLLKKVVIQVPCLEEQTKIANFLSSIDQKIEVVAQQIEQAKTWKKGLLQQMFV